MNSPEMYDFYISYSAVDTPWAIWIANILAEQGLSVYILTNNRSGNFVQSMDEGLKQSRRIIAVLSPSYLKAKFAQPEWQSAFARDPDGTEGILVPIRVEECNPTGLLAQVIYLDLAYKSKEEAEVALLEYLSSISNYSDNTKSESSQSSYSVEKPSRISNKKVPNGDVETSEKKENNIDSGKKPLEVVLESTKDTHTQEAKLTEEEQTHNQSYKIVSNPIEEELNTFSPKALFSSHPILLQRSTEVTPEERGSCLNVDEYAEALVEVLNRARGEICFAIFGHWGRGKTYLMKKVAQILSKKDYECVWFSAWKYRTKPEVWFYLYETLRKKALKTDISSEFENNENPISKFITSLLRKLKIYLVKKGFWMGVFVPSLITIPFLIGIPLGLIGFLLGLTFVLFGILFPLRIVPLILGISFNVSRFTGVSGKSFQIPEHAEKLGLQETIGEDLRHLLFGWVGFGVKNQKFIDRFIRFWKPWNFVLYFTLGLFIAFLFGRNVMASQTFWQNDILPLWTSFSQGDFFKEIVASIKNIPVIGPKLNSLIGELSKLISVNVPPFISSLLVWGSWFIFPLLPLPLILLDREKSKVLLIVDDLDRLNSGEILDIIESLKLLLEERYFSDLIQIAIICERRSLERAFWKKYEGMYLEEGKAENITLRGFHDGLSLEQLVEENIQKLFVSHIYLPPLGSEEQDKIMKYFLGYEENISEKPPKGVDYPASFNTTRTDRPIADNSGILSNAGFAADDNSERNANSFLRKPREKEVSTTMDILSKLDSKKNKVFAKFGWKKIELPFNETLTEDEREALLNAHNELSGWVRLGPRAIQSYIFRYQLARELLKARKEFVDSAQLARNLAKKLSGKPLEDDLSENTKAVLNEIA